MSTSGEEKTKVFLQDFLQGGLENPNTQVQVQTNNIKKQNPSWNPDLSPNQEYQKVKSKLDSNLVLMNNTKKQSRNQG